MDKQFSEMPFGLWYGQEQGEGCLEAKGQINFDGSAEAFALSGKNDAFLNEIAESFACRMTARGGKVEFFGTSKKAEEIMSLSTEMDQLELKLQRIKNEAAANKQKELNSKQLMRYNKTVREFNRVRDKHAVAIREFQAMKALNQSIFDNIGLSEFYKPYTEFPYVFSKKVQLANGVSASPLQLKDGTRKYVYSAYPFSDVAPNGNQIIEIKGAPHTYLAINSKNDRILSLVEERPGEKRKIYHFNEDGDVFKTAVFDPKTRTSKVYVNRKFKKANAV